LTNKVGFDEVDLRRLGSGLHTVVFHDDETHRLKLLEKVSVIYCSLTKVIRYVSENISICVFEAHLKSS
jgi:hypothetical protein